MPTLTVLATPDIIRNRNINGRTTLWINVILFYPRQTLHQQMVECIIFCGLLGKLAVIDPTPIVSDKSCEALAMCRICQVRRRLFAPSLPLRRSRFRPSIVA